MIFLRDSLCLSAVSLWRQRHDILDFSYCPLSRVLHVTLERLCMTFTANGYTVLMRPNKVETAVHGYFQFGLYRIVAPLSVLRSISLASLFISLFQTATLQQSDDFHLSFCNHQNDVSYITPKARISRK